MSTHTATSPAPRLITRQCDVAVIGGSAAGLGAALQLSRQRRSVIVIDSGQPRNAAAAHLHGYLGHDGAAPADLLATGREEVRCYGSEVLSGRVLSVEETPDGFRLTLTGGHCVVARRIVVATGLVDELPAVDGLDEHWGRQVIHCPFCHGYEARDSRIVVLLDQPIGVHAVAFHRRLTDHLTVVAHPSIDVSVTEPLVAAGIPVVIGAAASVRNDGDGRLVGVDLVDGTAIEADAVAVITRVRPRLEAVASLGLAGTAHPSGLGDVLAVGPTGETTVRGVYGVGNVVDPSHQMLHAAADGTRVGAAIAADLAHEDLRGGVPTANETEWDTRYSGAPMWSGNVNGTLAAEVASLAPGRALDVGAGEGGDAIWLAEHGWIVTATDVSSNALAHITAVAKDRDVSVSMLHADANTIGAFPTEAFDLVSAQYASIPRTPDDRAITNLLAAVAPGGTLLVVGHDLTPMRRPIDTSVNSRAFDGDAYVRVGDVARVVRSTPGWTVEIHETRPRPVGAASGHHVDDEVLRARRL